MNHVVPIVTSTQQQSSNFWECTEELQKLIVYSLMRASEVWEKHVAVTVLSSHYLRRNGKKFLRWEYCRCLRVEIVHNVEVTDWKKLPGYVDYNISNFIKQFPEGFMVFSKYVKTKVNKHEPTKN